MRQTQRGDVAVAGTVLTCMWSGSAWQSESTLHQLSPYIGKIKSSMAANLISRFSNVGDLVYDPFSGSGTVALEAWTARRRVVANDLSPYANLLTKAKLFPYRSLDSALDKIKELETSVTSVTRDVDLRTVPGWVRQFFHPETLREVIGWSTSLRQRREWFLLACLMGILHHQRPGFLSFPSSHTVPYLRVQKFPRRRFPGLYEYRVVQDRLEAKVRRAFRRVPDSDRSIYRRCYSQSADKLVTPAPIDAIVTSPPYMRQLDYGRDNRLRLWFLGVENWHALDKDISPNETTFLALMRRCFAHWKSILRPGKHCVLVIGDACSREGSANLPQVVSHMAADIRGYVKVGDYTERIPNERRVRRGIVGSSSETILVLKYVGSKGR